MVRRNTYVFVGITALTFTYSSYCVYSIEIVKNCSSRNIIYDIASKNLLSVETAPINENLLFSSRRFKALTKRWSDSGRNEENKTDCKGRGIKGNSKKYSPWISRKSYTSFKNFLISFPSLIYAALCIMFK